MSINHKTEALVSEVKRAFYATSMYSVCHELQSHAYINVQSLEGGSGFCLFCVRTYIYMHARTYTKGTSGDAVAGVPHLLSCERLPELALG